MCEIHFLSPVSKCYGFDHRASGYSRGEGSVMVVLKLLKFAIEDVNAI